MTLSSAYGEISQTASVAPAATTMQNASTANGNGTVLNVSGYATAIISITASVAMGGGTTINFEASVDGTTFVSITGTQVGTTNTSPSTSSTGDWMFNVAGYKELRARIGSYSSGTITVKGYSSVVAGAGSGNGAVQLLDSAGTNKVSISSGGALKVDGSAFTQPISASSLPLPTGAATAANQAAPGTAGTPSAAVVTVQGITSMTALKTDSSATTQPVSGTITANAGTNLNTSALALESGGNLATLAGAVSSSKVQSNVSQINGTAPSMDNGSSGTGTQRVTLADDSSGQVSQTASRMPSPTTMQNGATANGNGSVLTTTGYATAILHITASVAMAGGTQIDFEASVDGSSWVSILGTQVGTTTVATNTTATGDWSFSVAGYNNLRARISSYSSGNITVKGYVAVVSGGGGAASSSGSGNVNVSQINGATPSMGNGASGSGVQRVTLASDSTGQIAQTASIMPSATTMQNGATANGNGSNLTVTGYATAVLNITASVTMSGGTLINFEASVDGTTFVSIIGTQVTTGSNANSTIAPGDWVFSVAGYTYLRARISSYSAGTMTVKGYVSVSTNTNPKAALRGYVASNALFTVAASATDIIVFGGSSTKLTRVMSVKVWQYQTGTFGNLTNLALIKRSSADSGGTSTSVTAVPLDSNNAAATCTMSYYTANPSSLGTTVGNIAKPILHTGSGTVVFEIPGPHEIFKASEFCPPIILRSSSEQLAINLGGTTPGGFQIVCEIIWTEE